MSPGIPTGRFQRLAKIGGAAAGAAVKQAGTKAANVARSDERSDAALERRQLETAKQIVKVLGGMKGASMKIGQMLSYLDVGLVPAEHREEFQAELAKLRDNAPKVGFEDMRKVIEDELGQSVSSAFADFNPEPIAAASIGQVYRARLDDGRDVAVKVQYPGVDGAVRADMQNLGMLMRLARRITPQLDVEALAGEIRDRIVDELDYELEASNQRKLARAFRNHPFIVVPEVVTSMCRARVIVSQFVEGDGFDVLRAEPEEERNRLGEIIFRFYFETMYRHRAFSGDPHPGNLLRMPDGKVAFLDFGLFKEISPAAAELELSSARAIIEENPPELHRLFTKGGFISDPERLSPDALFAYAADAVGWYTSDREVELTPEFAAKVVLESSDPRSSHFDVMRHQQINTEHVLGRRLELLTLAVLCDLHVRGNWHRVAREWIYEDAPVTDLGRAEAEWRGA